MERIKLPNKLLEEIKDFIKEKSIIGERGWDSACEDEDCLISHFLAKLSTDETQSFFEGTFNCEWNVVYNKIRGRGYGAYEKIIGADAIITFEVKNKTTGENMLKSIIFQAKKEDSKQNLDEQKLKMDGSAEGGNFIFTCTSNGYFAQVDKNSEKQRIGDFLADEFIACHIGIFGLYYDRENKILKNKQSDSNSISVDEIHSLEITVDIK